MTDNELGNSSEKQVGMKRFPILGFTPGNTKAVFEMVDGFLNSCSDFVSRIPFVRTADRTRVEPYPVVLSKNASH